MQRTKDWQNLPARNGIFGSLWREGVIHWMIHSVSNPEDKESCQIKNHWEVTKNNNELNECRQMLTAFFSPTTFFLFGVWMCHTEPEPVLFVSSHHLVSGIAVWMSVPANMQPAWERLAAERISLSCAVCSALSQIWPLFLCLQDVRSAHRSGYFCSFAFHYWPVQLHVLIRTFRLTSLSRHTEPASCKGVRNEWQFNSLFLDFLRRHS